MQNPFVIYLLFLPALIFSVISLFNLFKKKAINRPRSYSTSLFFMIVSVISFILLIGLIISVFTSTTDAAGFALMGLGPIFLYLTVICSLIATLYHSELENLSFQKTRKVLLSIINGLIILVFIIGLVRTLMNASESGFFPKISKENAVEIASQQLEKEKKPGAQFKFTETKTEYCVESFICFYDVYFEVINNGKTTSGCVVSINPKTGPVYIDDYCNPGLKIPASYILQ